MTTKKLSLREKSFYLILLFIPFANIITLRLNSVIVYVVITFLLILSLILNLYNPKKITSEEKRLFLIFTPIFLLSIIYLISTSLFYIENFDNVLFFLQTSILVPTIPLFIDIKKIIFFFKLNIDKIFHKFALSNIKTKKIS